MDVDGSKLRLLRASVQDWNTERQIARLSLGGGLDDPYDVVLQGVSLQGLDLSGADLTDADLRDADLRHANLAGANLSRADLSGALFAGSELVRADLTLANLDHCNLESAEMGDTRLLAVDLATARGLLSVRHRFSSYVDTRTIEKCRQSLIDRREPGFTVWQFLLNSGVPPWIVSSLNAGSTLPQFQ